MRENHVLYIDKELIYEHPVVSATITHKLIRLRRKSRIIAVEYDNPTGFAGNATVFWEIALKQAAITAAQWSTDSDVVGQGTLTADTPVNLVNSVTDGDLVVPALTQISLVITKVGAAANLALGRIALHYKLVD